MGICFTILVESKLVPQSKIKKQPNLTKFLIAKLDLAEVFMFESLTWGSHAVIGVATKEAPLHQDDYASLVESNVESYGWDLIARNICTHNTEHELPWSYPANTRRARYKAPQDVYCILDMDERYLAFATDVEYHGIAFHGLKGKTLFPIVSSVYGESQVTMRHYGSSLDPQPRSLTRLS